MKSQLGVSEKGFSIPVQAGQGRLAGMAGASESLLREEQARSGVCTRLCVRACARVRARARACVLRVLQCGRAFRKWRLAQGVTKLWPNDDRAGGLYGWRVGCVGIWRLSER